MNSEKSTPTNNTLDATSPLASNTSSTMRLGWRIFLTLLLLLGLLALGLYASTHPGIKAAVETRPTAQSSSDPLVFAFYYTWFDEHSWTYDKLSDLPAQPYASRDRAVMGRHIDQAKRAGIDAFLVAWYGPQQNQTEPNLAALLDEAAARNFKLGILFETDSPFFNGLGDVTAALHHAGATHFNHSAYLRVDGRPVLFFWRPHIYGVGVWQDVRNQVDAGRSHIWISEGVDTGYLSVFDGHHLYSNTWNPPADLTRTNQKFANLVAEARQQFGAQKFWAATVMPGYNDIRIRPHAGFARDREGGAYYERAWQAAIASQPNWIVVNSFNEWPEGTYIEPSAAHGDHFLQLTANWSGQFKSGGARSAGTVAQAPPAPEPAAAPQVAAAPAPSESAPPSVPPPPPQPSQTPYGPTAYVTVALLNLRAGPSVDTPIVAQATQGAALPIVAAQPDWWQVDRDGTYGWVYAPLVNAVGLSDQTKPGAIKPKLPQAGAHAQRAPVATVTVGLLNLRSEPTVDAPILARLAQDTRLTITGLDAAPPEWVQVETGTAQGWVYADMVAVAGALDQAPIVR